MDRGQSRARSSRDGATAGVQSRRLADEAASQWISRHLESCPACLRTLESLSGDTLESLVRAAHKPDLTADFGDAAPADAEADDLSFLAPPQVAR